MLDIPRTINKILKKDIFYLTYEYSQSFVSKVLTPFSVLLLLSSIFFFRSNNGEFDLITVSLLILGIILAIIVYSSNRNAFEGLDEVLLEENIIKYKKWNKFGFANKKMFHEIKSIDKFYFNEDKKGIALKTIDNQEILIGEKIKHYEELITILSSSLPQGNIK